MTIILDAGALVAAERGDRRLSARLKREQLAGRQAITHGGVVAQVWRGGGRQANLARTLAVVRIEPLDGNLGRRAGTLLGATGTRDVVDAAIVLLARNGDEILTSDIDDLALLAEAAGVSLTLVPY